MVIHSIELCAGVGMLGEGVRAAFGLYGFALKTVCYVEREAYAASQLVGLMEAQCLDAAPIWSDLTTFDAVQWRGAVDCVIAGFPCQDLSVAGKRAGLDGDRSGLFFDVLRVANDCGAQGLILENVAGITTAGAAVMDEGQELEERAVSRVMGELADNGWDAEWAHLSASQVGASHGRERWFCFAWRGLGNPISKREHGRGSWTEQDGCAESTQPGGHMGHPGLQHKHIQQRLDGAESETTGQPMDGADNGIRPGAAIGSEPEHADPVICDGDMADASQPGRTDSEQPVIQGTRRRVEGGAVEQFRRALPIFAPGPTDERWRAIIGERPDLEPATQPGVHLLVNGVAGVVDASRNNQLRAIGNGVVPLCAAAALVELMRRAAE